MKALLGRDGQYMRFGKKWSKRRYVETVFEIVDFWYNNHIGVDTENGKKIKWGLAWWEAYDNKIPKGGFYSKAMNKAFHQAGGGEVSFVIACITAQHTTWGDGGVDLETPFLELRMWEHMPTKQRIALVERFYGGGDA